MDKLIWIVVGVGIVLMARLFFWVYWRFLGGGSLKGFIRKEEEPEGKYRVIHKYKTPTQRIALVEYNNDVWIYSNGDIMLSTTDDEDMYAETLVHIPMVAARKREKVLIIGGGGGITTREALCYSEVQQITTVDIDAEMVNLGKYLDKLIEFNNNSLNHSKVQTIVEDGRAFVENNRAKWDVIIVDIPEPNEQRSGLSRLFSEEFFSLLKERMEPDGAISIACSASSYMPEYFWSIQATLKKAGFHVLPYHYDFIVESGEDWGFCLATQSPVAAGDIKMLVSTRYLTPERLKDMFHMPFYFANVQNKGSIQTDQNQILLDIVKKAF